MATIDTVRGLAVLGILVMNIIGMGFARAAYLNPMYTGGDAPGNMALWWIGYVAFDGKMRALFAMLFGASLLLMAERAPLQDQTKRHVARMTILLLLGMVHASLLWSGDILLPFALVGLVIWPLRYQPASRLFLMGVMALALQVAINLSFGLQALKAEAAATLPGASAQALDAWKALRGATYSSPEDIAREISLYRGSLADILSIRQEAVLFARIFLLPFEFFAESLGLMLIGMGLYRLGWWQGGFPAAHYHRVAGVLIPLGWAAGAILAGQFLASGFAAAAFHFTDAARVLVAPIVSIGYAAALIALVKAGCCPWALSRLEACGRMALSNYIAASILGNLIFTGVGLGLYGSLSRLQVMGVVLLVWALQIGWSRAWLRRFRYGPLEWLWRSLARGARQPMLPPAYSG